MATIEHIVDDLDCSASAQTVQFAFDGTLYEIDLSAKNQTAFYKTLKPYIQVSRRVGGARPRKSPGKKRATSRKAAPKLDTAAIRAWAAENGIEVSARGRIPNHVLEAYQNA